MRVYRCTYVFDQNVYTFNHILHVQLRITAVDLWGWGGVQICTTYLVI